MEKEYILATSNICLTVMMIAISLNSSGLRCQVLVILQLPPEKVGYNRSVLNHGRQYPAQESSEAFISCGSRFGIGKLFSQSKHSIFSVSLKQIATGILEDPQIS